jgi:hypothetical protein
MKCMGTRNRVTGMHRQEKTVVDGGFSDHGLLGIHGFGMGFWALLVASSKMIRKVFQDRCLHINPCAQCNPWLEFSSDRAKRGYP